MKKSLRLLTVLACAAGLLTSSSLFAAKAKKKTSDDATAVPAAKYDKNDNGLLEPEEKEALAKAFKDGSNPALKLYDLDGDGSLSKEELAQINLKSDSPAAGKKPKKDKRRSA